MRNGILFGLLFLFTTGLLMAQSATPAPDGKPAANLPWDQTSYTGCLQSSMGHYTLIEDDGTSRELVGAAGKLKHQIGHQIEVIGKEGVRTVDRTQAGGASSVVELKVFEVKSVKQVAAKCKAAD